MKLSTMGQDFRTTHEKCEFLPHIRFQLAFRPLLDLLSQLPLRDAARDLRSGSGLTANRKNLPNASELYLAFDWASRSSRPALCYRPLLAFPPHFAMLRVTQLEPRTLHQPEKLKKLAISRKISYSRGQSCAWGIESVQRTLSQVGIK
jgi:hypothetical protein